MGISDEIPWRTELSVQEVRLCTWPLMMTSQWRYIQYYINCPVCVGGLVFSRSSSLFHTKQLNNIKTSKSTILLSLCDLSVFFLSLAFTNYFFRQTPFWFGNSLFRTYTRITRKCTKLSFYCDYKTIIINHLLCSLTRFWSYNSNFLSLNRNYVYFKG